MKTLGLRRHLLIWIALLALLAVTAGTSLLPLGAFNAVINFAIAMVKAGLVLAFFMHIGQKATIVRVVAAAGVFWLMLLVGLSLADFLWR